MTFPWTAIDHFSQSLAERLITELQQASAHSHTSSSAADDDDTDEEEEGVEEDVDNDSSHHTKDGSEPTTVSCPHPECKDKPPYSQKNNLQRHYTNRILQFQSFCTRIIR